MPYSDRICHFAQFFFLLAFWTTPLNYPLPLLMESFDTCIKSKINIKKFCQIYHIISSQDIFRVPTRGSMVANFASKWFEKAKNCNNKTNNITPGIYKFYDKLCMNCFICITLTNPNSINILLGCIVLSLCCVVSHSVV